MQIQKLQELLEEQKHKMVNRVWYSISLTSIPFLMLIINILSTINVIKENRLDLTIFLFFIIIFLILLLFQNIIKNIIAIKKIKKLNYFLNQCSMFVTEINEFKMYFLLFNSYYRIINNLLAKIVVNSNFCQIQNKRSLTFLNWKYFLIDLFLFLYSIFIFVSQIIYNQKLDWNNALIIISFSLMVLIILFILLFLIPRQINLNYRIKKFKSKSIDEYTYLYSKPWWCLKWITEKLED